MPEKRTKAAKAAPDKGQAAQDDPVASTPDVPAEGDAERIEGLDVAVVYAEPEADEDAEHGDYVQLVRTGWVRFFIGGYGRVRFRPARFGELRRILTAHEEMVDLIQEEVHRVQVVSDRLQEEIAAINEREGLSSEDRHAAIVKVQAEDRRIAREFRRFQEDHHIGWWQLVHAGDGDWSGLGVGGESLPDLDDMPMWITQAPLIALAVAHWKAVPLDRGRR